MPLVKVFYGLVEEENFLLSSPAADFLGSGAWSRTNEVFCLNSGSVLRRLNYDRFLIDIKIDTDNSFGEFDFFIKSGNSICGLSASPEQGGFTDLRLVLFDGFLQAYSSFDDGYSWSYSGGCEFVPDGELFQGFSISDGKLFISDYRLCASPYLTVLGFPPGTPARLVDEDGGFLLRYFDDNFQCRFFLERNRRCSFQALSPDESDVIFSSGFLDLTQGDSFLFTSEFLELIHNDKVLDFSTVALSHSLESFSVRNAASEPAANIHISVINDSADSVLISFDGLNWEQSIFIDKLEPGQSCPFSLKISHDSPHFTVNDFQIHIF